MKSATSLPAHARPASFGGYKQRERGRAVLHHPDELDWLAGLDWSRHGDSREGFVSGDIFLAQAAEMFGRAVCRTWPGPERFLQLAALPPAGTVAETDEAFDAAGKPVAWVHLAAEPTMRQHARRLGVALGDDISMTREEWQQVWDAGWFGWDDGLGARRAAAGIARIIARLAFEREMDVFARPVGAQGRIRLEAKHWEIDDDVGIRRLAVCGMALDRPNDAEAPVDHHLFVGHERLAGAIAMAARRWDIAVSFPEDGFAREVDHYSVRVSEVRKFLEDLMVDANSDWNNDRFMDAVQGRFGTGGLGRVFERAKAEAIAHPDRAYFGKPGRRKRPDATDVS